MPSFLTQCPHCLTSFRVTEAQLEAAEGLVRCGACLGIFSAEANRILLKQSPEEAAQTVPDEAAPGDEDFAEGGFPEDGMPEDGIPDEVFQETAEEETIEEDVAEPGDVTLDVEAFHAMVEEEFEDDAFDAPEDKRDEVEQEEVEEDEENEEEADELDAATAASLDPDPDASGQDFEIQLGDLNLDGDEIEEDEEEEESADEYDEEEEEEVEDEDGDEDEEALPEPEPLLAMHRPSVARVTTDKTELRRHLAALEDDEALEPLDDEALDAFEEDPVMLDTAPRRRWLVVTGLFLANVLLAAVLLLQYADANIASLSRSARFVPLMPYVCRVIDCPLPERSQLDLLVSEQLLVRSHPRYAQALEVNLVFRNDAAEAQPFPAIELGFHDTNRQLLANRLFTPAEYLPAELRTSEMPARSSYQVTLEMVDPGSEAVNYTLLFREP